MDDVTVHLEGPAAEAARAAAEAQGVAVEEYVTGLVASSAPDAAFAAGVAARFRELRGDAAFADVDARVDPARAA